MLLRPAPRRYSRQSPSIGLSTPSNLPPSRAEGSYLGSGAHQGSARRASPRPVWPLGSQARFGLLRTSPLVRWARPPRPSPLRHLLSGRRALPGCVGGDHPSACTLEIRGLWRGLRAAGRIATASTSRRPPRGSPRRRRRLRVGGSRPTRYKTNAPYLPYAAPARPVAGFGERVSER